MLADLQILIFVKPVRRLVWRGYLKGPKIADFFADKPYIFNKQIEMFVISGFRCTAEDCSFCTLDTTITSALFGRLFKHISKVRRQEYEDKS